MHVNTKTTNMELTEATSDYLMKRLQSTEKFLKGVDPESVIVNVELGKSTHHKSGEIFQTEINFCIGGDCMRAVSEKEDLYSAIDDAKDELMRELLSRKRKRISAIRRGGQKMKSFVRRFWRNREY